MSRSSSVCVPRGRFPDLCPPLGGVRDYALLSFSSVSDRLVARGLPPALAGDSAWLGVVAWPGRAKAVCGSGSVFMARRSLSVPACVRAWVGTHPHRAERLNSRAHFIS